VVKGSRESCRRLVVVLARLPRPAACPGSRLSGRRRAGGQGLQVDRSQGQAKQFAAAHPMVTNSSHIAARRSSRAAPRRRGVPRPTRRHAPGRGYGVGRRRRDIRKDSCPGSLAQGPVTNSADCSSELSGPATANRQETPHCVLPDGHGDFECDLSTAGLLLTAIWRCSGTVRPILRPHR
jgi:hypothetical protein